jgi:hypothetical protein
VRFRGRLPGPVRINPWELALQKNGDLCSCGMMNRVMTVEIANEASTIVT